MLTYYLIATSVFLVLALVARVIFSLIIIRDQNRSKAEKKRTDTLQKSDTIIKSAHSEVKEGSDDRSEDLAM